MRGYFGIGIENGKTPINLGTLWRSAHNLEAGFIFTVGQRYKPQTSDTTKAWRNIPLFSYESFDQFFDCIPRECKLIGVEYPHPRARMLSDFTHPERAIYLLGAEDHGLSRKASEKCHEIVFIPSKRCLNVAVAGSLVMYDRMTKGV